MANLIRCCLDVKDSDFHLTSGIQLFDPYLNHGYNKDWSRVVQGASKPAIGVQVHTKISPKKCVLTEAKKAGETNKQSIECILNAILPPRQWSEDGQIWIQQISTIPATRTDVINLQESLDRKLQQRQARETGICPIRRELYAQCLDELIRQITINCPERGLLLLRIRNEILMTFAAYETLYESSVAFGLRKALQGDLEKILLRQQIEALKQEIANLQNELTEMKAKYNAVEKRFTERKELDDKRHSEEIITLRRINQQLKLQLEGVITFRR
ncbi:33 kDa inner dynein arm light chain, axonemal-like [Pristis pectinata]|uniref:33 kDa inner dynein arm light chain, axonemal-like n=1 Tax=Pristis pectinata TaxID=685728 RepID=UPI00223DEBA6|nr:33 kDa inner dynein arm light chain, axonemal-like [Pristis pectinata]